MPKRLRDRRIIKVEARELMWGVPWRTRLMPMVPVSTPDGREPTDSLARDLLAHEPEAFPHLDAIAAFGSEQLVGMLDCSGVSIQIDPFFGHDAIWSYQQVDAVLRHRRQPPQRHHTIGRARHVESPAPLRHEAATMAVSAARRAELPGEESPAGGDGALRKVRGILAEFYAPARAIGSAAVASRAPDVGSQSRSGRL